MSEPAGTNGSVVITGASSGIGRSCAERLAAEGHAVFACVRGAGDAAEAERIPGEVTALTLDVTDADSIERAAEQVAERSGGALGALVNNAGTGIPEPLETIGLDRWREQLEVNLTGQLAVTQAFLPMLRRARGRIVFMGSIGGKASFPLAGPYIVSKHAIEALADTFRQELRDAGVEVVLIEPGQMDTRIWTKAAARARRAASELSGEQADRYRERLEDFADRLDGIPEDSPSPDKVADVVASALADSRPSSRYPVGVPAKLLYRVRPFIPDRLFDAAVSRI
ncbi:MAG TPA: SDR family oxidoreductase [Solirubrobacterales bacterium]|jgi:NAD(P)-dependent dehydrogenase (short-subunit alcohol dehydrogenase family)|nr:SDR family oxidoreductase [Solirubrobacterales bacterium]